VSSRTPRGATPALIIAATRDTSVSVLPEPAPAMMAIGSSADAVAAARWSSDSRSFALLSCTGGGAPSSPPAEGAVALSKSMQNPRDVSCTGASANADQRDEAAVVLAAAVAFIGVSSTTGALSVPKVAHCEADSSMWCRRSMQAAFYSAGRRRVCRPSRCRFVPLHEDDQETQMVQW